MPAALDEHPEMTTNLLDFAFASKKVQGFLSPLLRESSQGHELSVLKRSWNQALEAGAVVSRPDQVTFQVFESASPDATLCATLKRNQREGGHAWVVTYAGVDSFGVLKDVAVVDAAPAQDAPAPEADGEPASTGRVEDAAGQVEPPAAQAGDAPSDQQRAAAPHTNAVRLKDYAFVWVGQGSDLFKEVASLALPEAWGFSEGDYSILYSYLVQTFYKLRRDSQVLETEDRTFAAMNTGLVTPRYEDIYLCFKPNKRSGAQPWRYAGVCTQYDNRDHAKKLSATLRSAFPEMPRRARYFRDVSDIVFDASREVVCNWDHIIIENVDRIPTSFLASQLYGSQAAHMRDLVESIEYDPDRGSIDDPFGDHATGLAGEQFDLLRDFLRSSPMHFNRIRNAMEGALDQACKRAEYSFRTGVPSFYPTIDKVQILLPMCLMDEDEPDCALVTSKDVHGNYEGRTILTLRMAYNNARLLCRPESEWLSV